MGLFNINKQEVALSSHSVARSIRYHQDKSYREFDETSVEALRDHPYRVPISDYY